MEDVSMKMSVDEMCRMFPNTCIGISDVEFDAQNQIIAADVRYTDKSEEELIRMAIQRTGIRPFFTTTSDKGLTVGALAV